tara:strand:- start:97 stop:1365 length:1269 start_codon:yes stop_codon:yes gene_type:complete
MNRKLIKFTARGVALLVTVSALAVLPAGAEPPADISAVAAGNNRFALKLYQQLNDEEGNLFLSPYSISTALAMTYAGARGTTAAEMARALDFNLPQDELHAAFSGLASGLQGAGVKGGVELAIANALWPHKSYPFRQGYVDLIVKNYNSAGQGLDYGKPEVARGIINGWVEKETREKIKDLIPEGVIDSLTRMVLTNAIYFKGNWASEFMEKSTREMPFKITPEKSIKTPMMFQKGKFGYYQDADVQVLEMPYKGEQVSMFVLLPNQGGTGFRRPATPPVKKRTLADLEKMLTPAKLSEWLGKVRQTKVDTWFPKFKMTSEFSLSRNLQALGMRKAFGDADFSGMDGSRRLYLSAVLHKAFVEVNEEGTEAAAATAAIVGLRSARPMGPRFRADHPFLYLIRDKRTGSILFLGRYVTPPGAK